MVKPGDSCECGCGAVYYKEPGSDGTKVELFCNSLKGIIQKDTEFPDKLTKEDTAVFKTEQREKEATAKTEARSKSR